MFDFREYDRIAATVAATIQNAQRMREEMAAVAMAVQQSVVAQTQVAAQLRSPYLGYADRIVKEQTAVRSLVEGLAAQQAEVYEMVRSFAYQQNSMKFQVRMIDSAAIREILAAAIVRADYLIRAYEADRFSSVVLPEGPAPAKAGRLPDLASLTEQLLIVLLTKAENMKASDVIALLMLLLTILHLMALYGLGPMPLPPESRCTQP